jgi:hypothetical protein
MIERLLAEVSAQGIEQLRRMGGSPLAQKVEPTEKIAC